MPGGRDVISSVRILSVFTKVEESVNGGWMGVGECGGGMAAITKSGA